MVYIYILDSGFNLCGAPLDDFISLTWSRSYYGCGSFSLTCDLARYPYLGVGAYVMKSGGDEIGIIESVCNTRSEDGMRRVQLRGRFLTAKLENYVINAQVNPSGTAESVIYSLTQGYCKLTGVTYRPQKGLGGNVSVTADYENLLAKLREIALASELSFALKYNYDNNTVYFEVWKGVDRSEGQTANNPAIFADRFGNIAASRYLRDGSAHKNHIYVIGENTSGVRVTTEVNLAGNSERKSAAIFAPRQQSGISATDYTKQLQQLGMERLAKLRMVETIEASTSDYGAMRYKRDYDLGDICTVAVKEIGLDIDIRITGAEEVYENNGLRTYLTFGNEERTLKQFLSARLQ